MACSSSRSPKYRHEPKSGGRRRAGEVSRDERADLQRTRPEPAHSRHRMDHCGDHIQGDSKSRRKHEERRHLRTNDDAARQWQRSENLRIATIEGERVPDGNRNQRHDCDRPRGVEKLNPDHVRSRTARQGVRAAQIRQREQKADEQAARDEGRPGLREDLHAVGVRRDQIVLDEPLQEEAGQGPIKHRPSPRRRCPARSVRDHGARPGARTPLRANCSPGPCEAAAPSRLRPRGPHGGR